jgi:divalent metal cation (Fe/Co/Zn/Cd) transporter
MIADAVHSLSDFVTDLIVVLFVRISGKPCDADHDFGHGKYETLATASIGLMLFSFIALQRLLILVSEHRKANKPGPFKRQVAAQPE